MSRHKKTKKRGGDEAVLVEVEKKGKERKGLFSILDRQEKEKGEGHQTVGAGGKKKECPLHATGRVREEGGKRKTLWKASGPKKEKKEGHALCLVAGKRKKKNRRK